MQMELSEKEKIIIMNSDDLGVRPVVRPRFPQNKIAEVRRSEIFFPMRKVLIVKIECVILKFCKALVCYTAC